MAGDWWSNFATGEFATRIITPVLVAGMTSVVIAALNRWHVRREKRSDSVLDELKACIGAMQESSAAVATEVEMHLLGIPEGTLKDSQRRIGVRMKALGRQMAQLKLFLDENDANAIENAFLRWDAGLTGEGYPIQQKARAFQPHDAIIKRVQSAQTEWQNYLTDFKLRFIKGQCRLKHKA